MTPMSLSIVTVCMNRRQHLIETAARVAAWPHQSEHLILDWSSAVPLRRDELPDDDRVRLVRVDGERDWHLCRAYNLALQLACGDVLFKLDADCWPQPELDPAALRRDGSFCSFGSGPDGRLGQWILDRSLLEAVGGFNEFLVGYGFDDKDLRARVMARRGGEGPPLQARQLGVIVHSALERIGAGPESRRLPFREAKAQAQKRASAMANRVLAASCPWTAQRRGSRYRWNASSSSWLVDVESVLRAPIEVDEEVRRLRRTLFWGELMTLPAAVVRQLPERLLPVDQRGRLPVGALHRWLWYVIRPSWAWPSWLLEQIQLLRSRRSGGDGSKERFRAAYRSGDVEEMLSLLEEMEPRQRQQLVDRLLFQRAHRPEDVGTQIALLEGLQQMMLLQEHQRAYVLIALGWTYLRERSPDQAKRCIRPLEDDIHRLLADPETLQCGRRNRENRLKRLISCWNLLGHLHLQDENWLALMQLSGSSSDLLHRFDPDQLPGDVLLRVSSNWARTLLWQGPQQPQKLVDDLQRLLAIIESDRCAASRPEEDHRGFVRDWLRRMSTGMADPFKGVLSWEELASALTVSTPDLIAAVEQYWRQDAPKRP
jgi:hypothetical protein